MSFRHYVAPPHKVALYLPAGVLKSYLPALVFLLLGIGIGTAFTHANSLLGPKRPGRTKSEPYESGLPSEVKKSFRFGISFYLIAMLFILFDIEVVFLYPVALQLDILGTFALIETIVFVVLLMVAFGQRVRRGWPEPGSGHRDLAPGERRSGLGPADQHLHIPAGSLCGRDLADPQRRAVPAREPCRRRVSGSHRLIR